MPSALVAPVTGLLIGERSGSMLSFVVTQSRHIPAHLLQSFLLLSVAATTTTTNNSADTTVSIHQGTVYSSQS